jgi:tetratricopeptide (TPR) repeat protein
VPETSIPVRAAPPRPARLELRLVRGRVRVGLTRAPLPDGLVAVDLEMEVHGAPAAFDAGGGTSQFRSLPCSLLHLEVGLGPADALPGPESLDSLVAAALAPSGWPAPDLAGLRHAVRGEGAARRAVWQRPGAEALGLLEAAEDARMRGEPDAPLRFALAGQAALVSGLPVEGEAALRTALELGLGRDEARDAWAALAAIAREHADPAAERRALAGLIPAAPTGQRPALLLRLSELELAAEDAAASRVHAEEARTLAPRDPVAAEACLALARRAGDAPAVIDLLDRLAVLDPAGAGSRLLDRARLLAAAGRFLEADAGFAEALARLPPDRALADEHVALRRAAPPPVSNLPWGEPLETFAGRSPDASTAATAFRDAAERAREQGDLATALRAARRAHERSGDLHFVGDMLAGLLHAGGSVQEALALHQALLAPGETRLDPAVEAERLAALAELAEEAGHHALAVSSLDRLLELRPHDAEVVEWRFRVDPDRARALERLAGDADRLRSRRRRARLLSRAAAAARSEARDPARERDLMRRAQEAAAGLPAAELEVALARLASARAALAGPGADGPATEELFLALLAAAPALEATGDASGAVALREEAADVAQRGGHPERAVSALEALEAEAASRGDLARASALARRTARALLDTGDAPAAEQALRRALARDPADAGAWGDLESLALTRGEAGAPILAEVLADRARRTDGAARAEALVALSRVLRGPLGDPSGALQALRDALDASPGDASAESELDRLLATTGRFAELGRTLLDRSALEPDPDERARLRLRAAEVLTDAEDESTRALAVPALLAVLAEPPPGRAPLLEAAARLAALGRGAESAPYLLALCRSDPFDGAAARAVGKALGADPLARAGAFLAIADETPPGPVRAGHLREAAAAFAEAGDVGGLREATRATFVAWPVDENAFRGALADASGDVDATDAILSLRAAEVPAEAAACHRTRADLLLSAGRPGPSARAYESCLAADPSDASAVAGLAEARAAEGDLPGALAAARRASELAASQGRHADRRRSLETGVQVAASCEDRGDDAVALLESLAILRLDEGGGADPQLERLVSRAASALTRAGEDLRASALLSLAERRREEAGGSAPSAVPAPDASPDATAVAPTPTADAEKGPSIADLLRPLLASARALAGSGELGAAYARLKLAREIDPDHLELTIGLARVAEKLGHIEEAVSLGEAYADAIAPSDAAAAAARYRELADFAGGRLADADRAASLLEKATALDPEDPATAAALSSLRASRRGQALELAQSHLASLRERPSDVRAARAVAILSRELSAGETVARERVTRAERGAIADGLARFAQRIGPAPRPLDLAFGIGSAVRSQVALPRADGPTARLLSLLAPYLEPLFPVDLARFGVGPADRVSPAAAPALHGALEAATRALSGRPLALFCGRRPGLYAALENTRPPSLVLAADVASMTPGAIAFTTARSASLAVAGWALLGKFAPRDVLILCELAARFAGGNPSSRSLPPERAGAFLDALDRAVPPSMRDYLAELGPGSAAELGALDPLELTRAVEWTASRVALLHAGDLHGALVALARLQRPGVAPVPEAAAALERPDLADLARFALSDRFLELRGMLLGWP